MKKIISLTVAILFLVNNLSYALNVQPGSLNPATRSEMYAGAGELWRAKVGPGGSWIDRFLAKMQLHHFVGEKPEIKGITFDPSPRYYPLSWKDNPILHKKNLIEALECFRDTEAQIPAELLEIKEGYYELEKEKKGELPLARIEEYYYGLEKRHRLIIHTKLVQMWNHIRENDVWFDYTFGNDKTRTISLAWGIFYWVAKHEMMDLTKDGHFFEVEYKRTKQGTLEKQRNQQKGGGHIGYNVEEKKLMVNRDEMFASQIGGRHSEINNIFGLWFLQSYCFYDSTRYNNNVFAKRLSYILDPSPERSDNKFLMQDKIIETFVKEFPCFMQKYYASEKNKLAFIKNLELAINYHFFSRKGVKVPKLTVDPKLIEEYKDREYLIVGKPMYAEGKNEPDGLNEDLKWDYKFEEKALISADKISRSIKEKVNEEEKNQEDKKGEIPHQVRDDKSTVKHKTNIVSDYTAPLYKDEGPGVIKPLSEEKRQRVWQGVNTSRKENIEIFIPQSVHLTGDMTRKLIEVQRTMEKRGKVLAWERYSFENEGIDDFLKTIKENKNQAKRMVITEDETVPLLYALIDTKDNTAGLFRDVKMINVCLPGSLDEANRTQWQMDLFMTAILARLLEPGDTYFNDIHALLTDMLEGCFSPEIKAKDFVNMLGVKEDEQTSVKKVRERIRYFLLDTPSVSLIEKLSVEWEAIKEFYHHL